METMLTPRDDETLSWETVATKSRYGCYASEIEERAILKALSLIPSPGTALDLGCEGGRWSKVLSDLGWQLICMDVDQRSLNICKKRIPTATCVLVSPDDSAILCDAESIGLVLCIQVAPVIHADWFIDEAFRVLQKGGWVVGVFWNRSSWRGLVYHSIPALRVKGSNYWIGYPLSYLAWRKRFCNRGFTMVYEEGYSWLPFRRSSNSPLVPVAARVERYLSLRKLVSVSPMIAFIARKD
jgi:SAM-dependent methyltransferase